MKSPRRLPLLLLFAALVAPVPAWSAPALTGTASVADRAKARRAYQDGEAKLAKGDLEGALERFMASASVVPSAQAFRQVALLHERLGHVREAVAAYEAFLELAPQQREISEAQERIAALKLTPGRVVVRGSPRDARLVVDDDQSFDGLPVEVVLPPGEHRFVLTAEGHVPHEFTVDVAFATIASPAIDLEPEKRLVPPVLDLGRPEPVPLPLAPPAPSPALAPTGPSWASRHTAAFTFAGVALGTLSVGAYFGLESLDAQRAFDRRASSAEADRGERSAFRADIAFGSALLLGAAAFALFAHDEPEPAARAASSSRVAGAGPRATPLPEPF